MKVANRVGNKFINKNMKIYSIIITIFACLVLICGIYFLVMYSSMSKKYNEMSLDIENCLGAKSETEIQLSDAQEQLLEISKTNDVLKSVVSSFMIPGDLKAIAVDSQKSTEVEEKIKNIADSKDRMMIEQNWNDFKNSKLLTSVFDLFRDGVNNIERILINK